MLLAALLATALCGCSEPRGGAPYSIVEGRVERVEADTGQVSVRVEQRDHAPPIEPEQKLSCLVAADAEIYVNDACSEVDAIAIGDTIELIGYDEVERPAERFVVSFAYITRNEAPPPQPVLTPAQPATTNPSERNGS